MFDFAIVSEFGQRSYLEDAYSLEIAPDCSEFFCGIYDGHGGKLAAEYAKDNLHKIFFAQLKKGKTEDMAFKTAYEKVSADLKNQSSGTTAVTFYLKRKKKIFYANAGDARLVIIKDTKTVQLTSDHRLTNHKERERIRKFGGTIIPPYVYKGEYGLMPTRSLGDEYFKDVGIIATPETGCYSLTGEETWIIAGTDGLFDVIKNEETAILIKHSHSAQEAAQILKDEVLINRLGDDNLTFVLIK